MLYILNQASEVVYMHRLIKACFGRKVKFYLRKYEGYEIKLFHNEDNIRVFPVFSWIPYFWDSEIVLDIGMKVPKWGKFGDNWNYHWELRDLDNNIVFHGNYPKQGDDTILVTNKGLRRKLAYWNSGKKRAIVIGNLRPHKEYMLYVNFKTDNSESDNLLAASFSIADRDTWYMQAFLGVIIVLFTIAMTLFMRGCGVPA